MCGLRTWSDWVSTWPIFDSRNCIGSIDTGFYQSSQPSAVQACWWNAQKVCPGAAAADCNAAISKCMKMGCEADAPGQDCSGCKTMYPYCIGGETPTSNPACTDVQTMCDACHFKTCPTGFQADFYHTQNMAHGHHHGQGGGCFEGIQFIQVLEVSYWLAKSRSVWLHTFDWPVEVLRNT